MTVTPLSDIQDGGTQMRVEMKPDVVRDYADDMATGATFPPVVVYYDGTDYWLGDGFHRVEAARKLGHESIKAEVLDGDVRQAILHGIGSNASQDEEGEPVLKPGDRSYENTSNDWALLNRASLSARYLEPAWAVLGTSGFKNVALTDHIKQVILAPDGDDAGQAVIQEAAIRLAGQGREVRAAKLPPGLDWCDVLDTYEERAGIMEFDLEICRSDAEAIARREVIRG